MSSPAAEQFYRIQTLESKVSVGIIFGVVLVGVITFVAVLLAVRSHYYDFISDEHIGTSLAYMCAFAHVYPFLASVFFKNPNTPDILINVYYFLINADKNKTTWWGDGFKDGELAWKSGIVDPDNWRDAVGSIVWYAESNRNLGYNDVFKWATTSTSSGGGGVLAAAPSSGSSSLISSFYTYGLPLVSTGLMLLGMLV